MELLRQTPDKFYDLCIVDPPYGIKWHTTGTNRHHWATKHGGGKGKKVKSWDVRPPAQYWLELRRVSRHCIVFGAQYFLNHLESTECIVVWDKGLRGMYFSDAEIAWTSFLKNENIEAFSGVRIFSHRAISSDIDNRIHPTQKPVALYRWLLKNYAKPGQRILDTHGGSMSIAIACDIEGFDLTLCEIDKDYFEAGKKRLEQHQAQPRLFEPEKPQPVQASIL